MPRQILKTRRRPLIFSPSDELEPSLSGRLTNARDFNQIVRDDTENDAVSVPGSREQAVALKGIEHGGSYLRKISQDFKLGHDLVLYDDGKGLQISSGPREEFNPSWHAVLFWP